MDEFDNMFIGHDMQEYLSDIANASGSNTLQAQYAEHLASEQHYLQESMKRGAYARARDDARVPFTLSLEDVRDTKDQRDMLRQAILATPREELIAALDLVRAIRVPIAGLKKGNIQQTYQTMDKYAKYLYSVWQHITQVDVLPSDDPFWANLDTVHRLVDGYIEKGEERDELVRALRALPQVTTVYVRDDPVVKPDFHIETPVPSVADLNAATVDTREKVAARHVIDNFENTKIEDLAGDIARALIKTIGESRLKAIENKEDAKVYVMDNARMPDGVHTVVDRLQEVGGVRLPTARQDKKPRAKKDAGDKRPRE